MAAATVLQDVREFCNLPGIEVVRLEVSDGETYVSRKFSSILAVVPGLNSDNDLAGFNATFSGKTVTVNHTGAADRVVTLLIFGAK